MVLTTFEAETRAADVMTVVGVEEQVEQTTFNVYPNPVENVAWVDSQPHRQ